MQNYAYPIDPDWTMEESVQVVEFLAMIEQVYENTVTKSEFALKYQRFKQVVTSISSEKQIDKIFAEQSGYSIYLAVKEFKRIKIDDKIKNVQIRR